MNYINQRNYHDLINWLINYCYDHKIGVCLTNELPDSVGGKSYIAPANLVVVNNQWHDQTEIPFIFAHEIGHIFTGIPCFYHSSTANTSKQESEANVFAINLLKEYCESHDISFDNYYSFAQTFCIPRKVYYLMPDCSKDWIME